MYARVTLLEVDVVRADVDALLSNYRTEVLPEIQSRPGYEGVFVMVNPEGQGLILTLWSDEDALESSTPVATAAAERFVTFFRAAPGRESYEVRLAEIPALAVG